MRALWLLVCGCLIGTPSVAGVYRHMDESGNVTYSDRPQAPGHSELLLPPPNVATPEARRQLELARQRMEREERAEQEIRLQRWAAAQRTPAYPRPRTLTPYSPRQTPGFYAPAYTTSSVVVVIPRQDSPSRARRR